MTSQKQSEIAALNDSISHLKLAAPKNNTNASLEEGDNGYNIQTTCFSEVSHDGVNLHFQIIRLPKQIYVWIGCNTAKFGHLYAAGPTPFNNAVAVTCLLGGTSDNTGSGIARRLVLKTGLNIIVACNIPKNSPMLEAEAEKKLMEKLISLGYAKPRSQALSSQ